MHIWQGTAIGATEIYPPRHGLIAAIFEVGEEHRAQRNRCVSAQVGNDRVERSGEAAPLLACGWNHDSPMLDPCGTKQEPHN
jgi:hypothetical protein